MKERNLNLINLDICVDEAITLHQACRVGVWAAERDIKNQFFPFKNKELLQRRDECIALKDKIAKALYEAGIEVMEA
jgi:hypothetical protein